MKKMVLIGIGVVLILIGAVDWLVGALVPHSRVILIIGAVAVAAAGFMHQWQKLQNPKWPLLMTLAIAISGATDVCAASQYDVLIRPEVTPMIQRSLVAGPEEWLFVLIISVCLGVVGLGYLMLKKPASR